MTIWMYSEILILHVHLEKVFFPNKNFIFNSVASFFEDPLLFTCLLLQFIPLIFKVYLELKKALPANSTKVSLISSPINDYITLYTNIKTTIILAFFLDPVLPKMILYHFVLSYIVLYLLETKTSPLFTLVLLNPDIPCLLKQCRSRSDGFWRRSQLIWICTVCHSVSEFVSTTWIK